MDVDKENRVDTGNTTLNTSNAKSRRDALEQWRLQKMKSGLENKSAPTKNRVASQQRSVTVATSNPVATSNARSVTNKDNQRKAETKVESKPTKNIPKAVKQVTSNVKKTTGESRQSKEIKKPSVVAPEKSSQQESSRAEMLKKWREQKELERQSKSTKHVLVGGPRPMSSIEVAKIKPAKKVISKKTGKVVPIPDSKRATLLMNQLQAATKAGKDPVDRVHRLQELQNKCPDVAYLADYWIDRSLQEEELENFTEVVNLHEQAFQHRAYPMKKIELSLRGFIHRLRDVMKVKNVTGLIDVPNVAILRGEHNDISVEDSIHFDPIAESSFLSQSFEVFASSLSNESDLTNFTLDTTIDSFKRESLGNSIRDSAKETAQIQIIQDLVSAVSKLPLQVISSSPNPSPAKSQGSTNPTAQCFINDQLENPGSPQAPSSVVDFGSIIEESLFTSPTRTPRSGRRPRRSLTDTRTPQSLVKMRQDTLPISQDVAEELQQQTSINELNEPTPQDVGSTPFKKPARKSILKTPSANAGKEKEHSNGSHVIVLTPVWASRQQREELGSEQVLTGVRRSVRRSTPFKKVDRENLVDLLSCTNYSYSPNVALKNSAKKQDDANLSLYVEDVLFGSPLRAQKEPVTLLSAKRSLADDFAKNYLFNTPGLYDDADSQDILPNHEEYQAEDFVVEGPKGNDIEVPIMEGGASEDTICYPTVEEVLNQPEDEEQEVLSHRERKKERIMMKKRLTATVVPMGELGRYDTLTAMTPSRKKSVMIIDIDSKTPSSSGKKSFVRRRRSTPAAPKSRDNDSESPILVTPVRRSSRIAMKSTPHSLLKEDTNVMYTPNRFLPEFNMAYLEDLDS